MWPEESEVLLPDAEALPWEREVEEWRRACCRGVASWIGGGLERDEEETSVEERG